IFRNSREDPVTPDMDPGLEFVGTKASGVSGKYLPFRVIGESSYHLYRKPSFMKALRHIEYAICCCSPFWRKEGADDENTWTEPHDGCEYRRLGVSIAYESRRIFTDERRWSTTMP